MLTVIYHFSTTMVKDVFFWTDTPESMDSAKPLELQPTTPSQTLPSAVQAIQF